ncbi:hypothetical protein F2Q70_00030110 [Brassica cretica]|uniref:Uncharacterized protein n=1 Tax=Brassica cretica TaxID=69181 RepID=A0A8S9FMQ6_BRACR|nr:hypothetical protein F2Q70_00030110 [Brassica cretica]
MFEGTNADLQPNLTKLLVLGLGIHGIGFFKQEWKLVELVLDLGQLPDHSPSSLKLPFTSSWLNLTFLMPLTLSLSHDTLVFGFDELTGVSPRTMARPG